MLDHRPVMLAEALTGLDPRPGGTYVDGTFGRGGHSGAVLEALQGGGMLHALDRDPAAGEEALNHFGARPNFRFHARNFAELGALAREMNLNGQVAGLLLDLGVSSPQFDDAERGFSFANDGPLDMRMDPGHGESAAQWLARAKESEIADVLFHYGEERASRRIARRIVEQRVAQPIERTAQLAELIARAVPGPRQKIHPATRSFQAIRIHINQELQALEAALQASLELLCEGGRLAVISFHSLEDRIVKRFLRGTVSGMQGAADAPQWNPALSSRPPAAFRVVGRYFPSEEEIALNPRARSAVLRVAERQTGSAELRT
jgi:16S rRNA (cytosine1402-N4)-methyltransferase